MSNAHKTPLSRSLNQFAQNKALDEIAKLGLCLPGRVISVTGAIVTVSFEVSGLTLPQATMPLASAEYIRLPIKAGDMGVAIPASVYLGGVSGLGGGVATDTLLGNLTTLFWQPIGSKNWSSVDPTVVTIYGPNGVTLQNTDGSAFIKITPSSITLTAGGKTINVSSDGIVIDGITFETHMHSGITTGTGDSGPPLP